MASSEVKLVHTFIYEAPFGLIQISGSSEGITDCRFTDEKTEKAINPEFDCLLDAKQQLDEYFSHERKEFSVSLDVSGTPAQKQIWDEIFLIPFGSTQTYRRISHKIQGRYTVKSITNACVKNKAPIFIPCHRVISSDGDLNEYVTDIKIKEWLLKHEGANFIKAEQASLF